MAEPIDIPMHAVVTARRSSRFPHLRTRTVRLQGEVHDSRGITATFHVSLYNHHGVRDVFLDITTTTGDARFTFTTRTGPVEPDGPIASTMLDATTAPPAAGRQLTRDEALARPDLPSLWELSDTILADVDEIGTHLASPAQ